MESAGPLGARVGAARPGGLCPPFPGRTKPRWEGVAVAPPPSRSPLFPLLVFGFRADKMEVSCIFYAKCSG
jgi:hypothetical protein